ncbi:ABC transporter permease [Devosia sp.]|uniref:ABC transporter permease n=1 Tax=Devosia sp. TaxID=1871048 RepID=UPI002FCB660A
MTLAPRWKKLVGDFVATRGRVALMLAALAIGMLTLTTIAGAYAILTREISRNYLATNPASALIDLGQVTPEALELIRNAPGVADAELISIVVARARAGDGPWLRTLLFVAPNPTSMRIGRFLHSGAASPADDAVLLEREAAALLGAQPGDRISIQVEGNTPVALPVASTVHDPSLAPAWQEQTAYIYLSSATGARLGLEAEPELVKMTVADASWDQAQVDAVVIEVAAALRAAGHTVHQVQIPPVGQHPHQSQMTGVLSMFLVFALLALVLSAVLTAAMIAALLAQQVRQIAIMKTVGGTARQIAALYLSGTALLALAATAIGLPIGLLGASGFAGIIAQLLNFDIASAAVPLWLIVLLVATGLILPLGLVLLPVRKASRATVREALSDQGVSASALRRDPVQALLGRLRGLDRTLLLALRNAFRRPARLLLNLALMGTAGGLFIAALNVEGAWKGQLVEAARSRDYAIAIDFLSPAELALVASTLAGVPGIVEVVPATSVAGAAGRPDGLMLVRTYPDGGHGSLTLRPLTSLPDAPGFILGDLPRQGEGVTNQQAFNLLGRPSLAEPVLLASEGRTQPVTVSGVARQILVPATAYLPDDAFAAISHHGEGVTSVRVVVAAQASEPDIAAIADAASLALSSAGVTVEQVTTEATLVAAQSGHVTILIVALQAMAMLMAAVGSMGLAASLGSSVTERTREFGIMRTIGASGGALMRNILGEGLMVAWLSLPIALALGVPLGYAVGQLVGTLSFGLPLPLTLSAGAVGIWALLLSLGAILASLVPARRAASLTIRQTLAYS